MNKKQRNALITIAIGAIIWFMPVPAGVTVVAWHLAAVFIATVVGFILQPLPIGAVAFIAVSVAVGALPLMTAIIFGIFADVPISLTHYGNGCAPIYYGAGYVSQSEWWKNGFVMTTITPVISLTIGAAWWKVIGLW